MSRTEVFAAKNFKQLTIYVIWISLKDILPSVLRVKLFLFDLKAVYHFYVIIYLREKRAAILVNRKHVVSLAEEVSCVPIALPKVDDFNEEVLEVIYYGLVFRFLRV